FDDDHAGGVNNLVQPIEGTGGRWLADDPLAVVVAIEGPDRFFSIGEVPPQDAHSWQASLGQVRPTCRRVSIDSLQFCNRRVVCRKTPLWLSVAVACDRFAFFPCFT